MKTAREKICDFKFGKHTFKCLKDECAYKEECDKLLSDFRELVGKDIKIDKVVDRKLNYDTEKQDIWADGYNQRGKEMRERFV